MGTQKRETSTRMPEHFSRGGTSPSAGLLAVSASDSERFALKTCTAGTRWTIHEAHDIREALAVVARQDIAAILTDRNLSDGAWTDLVERLRSGSNPPRVIVFSPVADDKFWAEVLGAGGYDLVATPFERAEVLRVTHMAWLSWLRTARITQAGEDAASGPRRWFARSAT
jgi:DNA-binding response OmpR family regulator